MVLEAAGSAFVMTERPDPVPGPGEAVARVLACGAGLTIQHVKAGRKAVRFPRVIGHEITGEIVAVGRDVAGLSVGDAVTAYYYLNCGRCAWCRDELEPLCPHGGGNVGVDCDGGYAEYVRLPAHIFVRLPPGLDHRARPAEIAVVTDAVATPYKVLRRARVKSGETVAVFGAGGGLGIHQLMMARRAGARVVAVEIAADKAEACRRAGADEIVNPRDGDVAEVLRELTKGQGVDVAIDYVSATATLEAGVRALGPRGRLVTLGGAGQPFGVSSLALLAGEQEILGSRYVTRRDIHACLDLVARGEIRPLVSVVRPLDEAETVHDLVERGAVTGRAALLVG
ncbi:zinc-binding dehydrogenase [Rhodoplanes sp. TEM]|uniref:alcohol dehydrogenase n=1 Tax=Rhodoplanes tepidamans TaxID=200616 RepID=A0ABT5JHC8_RHOTP|nr:MULTISPECIES: zinc-binding dehydrogenase [Rhodoplanes]MDC7788903.1 zinc-binding dehydrogenase [Rhodoplanes tepidamans]MDC7985610.1 zinc-binding dehydrogenase [Rhodoplanes sp. TEM]MDQ0358762.1 propanol-preferring alcohol dehydrogenase [Rhodoplanes tepidamans]